MNQRFDQFVPLTISNQITEQFPGWYQEKGPRFVAFVKAYYEWLETTGNALYYTRNFYNIRDIDNTLDEFVIYFKEQYLKNIQLDTKTDTRTLVKHALDIYRSKGTPRCIELLFRLVFGEDVELYYPSTDLFKLSDGVWFKPTYLEIQLSEKNINLLNKEVTGITSGAVAYINSVVRRMTKGRLQDVAYISAINGIFQTGEKIQPTDLSISLNDCPVITGSLSSLLISTVGTGQNYANGNLIAINGTYGESGIGRVKETIEQFGQVEVSLEDGGYGFNVNSTIYISNTMMYLSNVQMLNTSIEYFKFRDMLSQEQVWLNYYDATNPFQLNQEIFTYYGNGDPMGHGIILSKNQLSTTNGALLVGVISGDLANTFYTTANADNATLQISNGHSWANATGRLIAYGHIDLTITGANGTFAVGNKVIHPYGIGYVESMANNVLTINNVSRVFRSNNWVYNANNRAVATVTNVAFEIGLCNTENTFYVFDDNQVTANNFTATVDRIELGSGLNLILANSFLYTETIPMVNAALADYLSVNLNSATFGFPNASANLTTCTIDQCFNFANVTIGKATAIITSNTGSDYSHIPFIVVDHQQISDMDRRDVILFITGANYANGDFIQQTSTGARGIVKSVNSTAIFVQNLRISNTQQFAISNSTANTQIFNTQGLYANITAIDDSYSITGRNMAFDAEFTIGTGSALKVEVVDSGFGFINDETVFLGNNNGSAIAQVATHGTGSGYYKEKGGFLSDQKKLFDGYYWQNYSYEVRSALMLSKYEKLLKQVTHIAGTIMFGQVKYKSRDNNELTSEKAKITFLDPIDIDYGTGTYISQGIL